MKKISIIFRYLIGVVCWSLFVAAIAGIFGYLTNLSGSRLLDVILTFLGMMFLLCSIPVAGRLISGFARNPSILLKNLATSDKKNDDNAREIAEHDITWMPISHTEIQNLSNRKKRILAYHVRNYPHDVKFAMRDAPWHPNLRCTSIFHIISSKILEDNLPQLDNEEIRIISGVWNTYKFVSVPRCLLPFPISEPALQEILQTLLVAETRMERYL